MAESNLTAARLREVIHYDPSTGVFIRKVRLAHRHRVGDIATRAMSNGYLRVAIDSERYLAHRLAWLYVHGVWPEYFIDHINGVITDNRIANLRDAPRQINQQNRRSPSMHNKSGFLGVHFHPESGKWRARVGVDGKTIDAGLHATAQDAHFAYVQAKRKHHPGCSI